MTMVVVVVAVAVEYEYIRPYAKLDFIEGRLLFRDLTSVSQKPTSAPFPSIVCIYQHA